MKRLIIHIGYPKTATTSLQLNLFADLHKNGQIEYLNHLNQNSTYLGNIYCRNILQSIISQDNFRQELINNELLGLKNITKETTVISAETLSVMYPGFSYSVLSSKANENAQKFKNIFGEYFDTIDVIIGIRAQVSIIRAVYKQWYHWILGENSKYKKFELWLNDNFKIYNKDDIMFNYNTLVRSYINVFGIKHVHILVYEDLLYDKNEYYKKLSNIFNIDEKYVIESLNKEIKNRSMTTTNNHIIIEGATFGQIVTRPFRKVIKKYFGINFFNFLKKAYHILIPYSFDKIKVGKSVLIRELTSTEINLIYQKYKQSNLQLIKTTGLDEQKMKEYKYI